MIYPQNAPPTIFYISVNCSLILPITYAKKKLRKILESSKFLILHLCLSIKEYWQVYFQHVSGIQPLLKSFTTFTPVGSHHQPHLSWSITPSTGLPAVTLVLKILTVIILPSCSNLPVEWALLTSSRPASLRWPWGSTQPHKPHLKLKPSHLK